VQVRPCRRHAQRAPAACRLQQPRCNSVTKMQHRGDNGRCTSSQRPRMYNMPCASTRPMSPVR
jgi:hypothetical protein